MLEHHGTDGRGTDSQAEFAQFTLPLIVVQPWIVLCQAQDARFHLLINGLDDPPCVGGDTSICLVLAHDASAGGSPV